MRTSRRRRALSRRFRRELFSRRLASGGFTCGLFRARHRSSVRDGMRRTNARAHSTSSSNARACGSPRRVMIQQTPPTSTHIDGTFPGHSRDIAVDIRGKSTENRGKSMKNRGKSMKNRRDRRQSRHPPWVRGAFDDDACDDVSRVRARGNEFFRAFPHPYISSID